MPIQAMYHAMSDLISRVECFLDAGAGVLCEVSSNLLGTHTVPASGILIYDRPHIAVQFAVQSDDSSHTAEAASSKQSGGGGPKKGSLQDKVNSILSLADEDEEDAELLEELSKPKKKFFGLFG